jgi:hypothetical protein
MKLDNVDGFSFDFKDALDAFVFDEKDKSKRTYHGQPMKAVDIVAEFNEAYVFVEIKNYDDPAIYDDASFSDEEDQKKIRDGFKWLKNYLKYKYRDSYLYRHAEHKVDKPIHYICLLNFDNALNTRIQKTLRKEIPVGKTSKRWKQALLASCQVLNLEKWNQEFTKWPATRIIGDSK